MLLYSDIQVSIRRIGLVLLPSVSFFKSALRAISFNKAHVMFRMKSLKQNSSSAYFAVIIVLRLCSNRS